MTVVIRPQQSKKFHVNIAAFGFVPNDLINQVDESLTHPSYKIQYSKCSVDDILLSGRENTENYRAIAYVGGNKLTYKDLLSNVSVPFHNTGRLVYQNMDSAVNNLVIIDALDEPNASVGISYVNQLLEHHELPLVIIRVSQENKRLEQASIRTLARLNFFAHQAGVSLGVMLFHSEKNLHLNAMASLIRNYVRGTQALVKDFGNASPLLKIALTNNATGSLVEVIKGSHVKPSQIPSGALLGVVMDDRSNLSNVEPSFVYRANLKGPKLPTHYYLDTNWNSKGLIARAVKRDAQYRKSSQTLK